MTRRGLAVWGGLLGLAGCLGMVGAALVAEDGLQTSANVAQLVSVVLAVLALAVSLLVWSRRVPLPVVTPEAVAAAMTLAVSLQVALLDGLVAGLATTLAISLAWGISDALTAWAEAPTPAGQANTPLTNWRADRTLNLVRAATVGLTSGLTGGLAGGFAAATTSTDSPAFALAIGLTYGLTFCLTAGLATGHHHAWMAYVITTVRLARTGHLPRGLMHFLDDAHRLGLLRTVGPIYQFRHAELHDHLAATAHLSPPGRTLDGQRSEIPGLREGL